MQNFLNILILFAVLCFFVSCTSDSAEKPYIRDSSQAAATQTLLTVAPTATIIPTTTVTPSATITPSATVAPTETAGEYEFSTSADLDSDGFLDNILLTVENYNEPTLHVGKESLKFSEHDDSIYDAVSFEIRKIGKKKSLIFITPGSSVYLNCAIYDSGKLFEAEFPISFKDYNETLFNGRWIDIDSFIIECSLGGKAQKCNVDAQGFAHVSGQELSKYKKNNIFCYDDHNITEIKEDGTVVVIFVLRYEYSYAFASAYLSLKYNSSTKAFTVDDVTYKLHDGEFSCGVTFVN